MGMPSSDYDATFVVHHKSDTTVSITEQAARCAFEATATGPVFTATAIECALAGDSPARQLGLYRELFDEFVMDTAGWTFHSSVQHWQKVNSGSGHSCAVAEGHRKGRLQSHHYATGYRFYGDRAADSTDCGRVRVYGNTSGYVLINALDSTSPSLHWEGVGCDVAVTGPAGGPWSASDQRCVMSANSLAPFGITAIDLDALDYDPQTEAFTAKGSMTRAGGANFCFEISAR